MSERTSAAAGAPADDVGAVATLRSTDSADDSQSRRERLKAVYLEARACEKCPQLVSARTQVVFGGGNADADLMFIGEAPGAREDEQGTPFVGASGKLLDELLASAGLAREDVFIANALKCRPPGNRDPSPAEIERCRPYLEQQIALVQPRVIVTLGNFATRLLRRDSAGISELHGRAEIREVAGRAVYLLPLFHPAAALYTRSLLDTLRSDFARLPELVARPALPQPEAEQAAEPVAGEGQPAGESQAACESQATVESQTTVESAPDLLEDAHGRAKSAGRVASGPRADDPDEAAPQDSGEPDPATTPAPAREQSSSKHADSDDPPDQLGLFE